MDLLARREHSRKELSAKLLTRGFSAGTVDNVLTVLADEDLLSEKRFAEAFIAARSRRGKGPIRLRAELRQRGLADSVIEDALADSAIDWLDIARRVLIKKFGDAAPSELQERARQTRFLEYRGFDAGLIRAALDC